MGTSPLLQTKSKTTRPYESGMMEKGNTFKKEDKFRKIGIVRGRVLSSLSREAPAEKRPGKEISKTIIYPMATTPAIGLLPE